MSNDRYDVFGFDIDELALKEDGESSMRIYFDEDFTRYLLARYRKWNNVTLKRVKRSIIDWIILHHGS